MASAVESSVVGVVVRLDLKNYVDWQRVVRARLRRYGLGNFVDGAAADLLAEFITTNGLRAAVDGEDAAARAARLKLVADYDAKYGHCLDILLSWVTDDVRRIVDAEHPWDIWAAYRRLSLPKESLPGDQDAVEGELESFKLGGSESLEQYFARLKVLIDKWETVYTELPDEDDDDGEAVRFRMPRGKQVHHFLRGLPIGDEVWRAFKLQNTSFNGSLEDVLKAANTHYKNAVGLMGRKNGVVQAANGKDDDRQVGVALAAAEFKGNCLRCGKRGHKATDCKKDRKDVKCKYCKRRGHVEKVCFAKKQAEESSSDDSSTDSSDDEKEESKDAEECKSKDTKKKNKKKDKAEMAGFAW